MEEFLKYLPLIIPLVLIQLALMVFALIDLAKREKTRGPKWLWVLIIVFGEMFGPIIYFVVGRTEDRQAAMIGQILHIAHVRAFVRRSCRA